MITIRWPLALAEEELRVMGDDDWTSPDEPAERARDGGILAAAGTVPPVSSLDWRDV